MIAWMLYCVTAGMLVVMAARAAEWVTRLARIPVRWCWVAAIGLTVALAVLAPYRRTAPIVIAPTSTVATAALPLDSHLEFASRGLPSSTAAYVAAAWIGLTVFLVGLMLAVHARLRRARRTWLVTDLHGARVRVSPVIGPVVVGFARPEIVVPRWLLDRSLEEQRLVVEHEVEHVRARDTLVLGGACVAAAIMPWNPGLWYALSRLRLAVELDCDARVLRRGVAVDSYGLLLIDVAARASLLRFGAAALANSPSHLHQRILAMKTSVPKFARLRGGVVGLLGAVALVAACEAKMPTAVEVERMDVGSAERRLAELSILPAGDSAAVYLVDYRRVPRAEALALKPDDVASVEVVKDGDLKKIVITTQSLAAQAERLNASAGRLAAAPVRIQGEPKMAGNPLVLIDGVHATLEAFKKIDRNDIESVEVIKGPAAIAVYGDSAVRGVVAVKTKRGAGR